MQLILPVLIPLVSAATSLLGGRHLGLVRLIGVGGAVGQFAAAIWLLTCVMRNGIQVQQMGNWPAPYGITLVADHLSALMVLVTGIIGTAIAVYSTVDVDTRRQSYAYFTLLHLLLMSVAAAFLAGDIFNLYVWLEVMLISSFVLLALGSERPQLEGALKYVTLNLVSSFVFLSAVGILYGAVGTLNMAHAAQRLEQLENPHLVTTLAMLFLTTLGIKSALFPLFFWLPASYHTPPAAVSALFAGLLTKVGVYGLIRVFSLLFTRDVEFTHTLLLIASGLTMLTGVLGAIVQEDFRRILSFHIISQIGYMILGLGLFTPLGIAGTIFYVVHHIIVKTNLFLIAGIAHQLQGHYLLNRMGGLYADAPWLALLFAVPALSLAGLPPLSGFVAKLILVQAGLAAGEYMIVFIALLVSLLTLYSMAKIFREAFWKPAARESTGPEETKGEHPTRELSKAELIVLLIPVVVLAVLTVLIGVLGVWLLSVSEQSAQQLLDPQRYIQAVLGENA